MRLHVKGRFPVKSLAFVLFCVQEYNFWVGYQFQPCIWLYRSACLRSPYKFFHDVFGCALQTENVVK